MTQPQLRDLTDARLREALTQQPQADHLAEQLDMVVVSVRRTRQIRLATNQWLLLAAAAAIILLLLVLALVALPDCRARPAGSSRSTSIGTS